MTFLKTVQTLVAAENSDPGSASSKLHHVMTPAPGMKKTQNPARFDSWSDATSATLCTMRNYWRHFKADRRLLLPWKRNL